MPASATPCEPRPGIRYSVVVPAHEAGTDLVQCLAALKLAREGYGPDSVEIILVDDGSARPLEPLAHEYGARCLRRPQAGGPAQARNLGAAQAGGEILVFVDSDVVAPPDIFSRLDQGYDRYSAEALVGLFTLNPLASGLMSRYKNSWMRYTHLKSAESPVVFFTSIATVRREAFNRVGGFDRSFGAPSVEDTDFGQRLLDAGAGMRLLPELTAGHLKSYTLAEVLRLDFRRSRDLTRYTLRHRKDTSRMGRTCFDIKDRLAVMAAALAPLGLAAAILGAGWWGLVWLAAGWAVVDWLHAGFLAELRRAGGAASALAGALVLPWDLLAAAAGVAWGLISRDTAGLAEPEPQAET